MAATSTTVGHLLIIEDDIALAQMLMLHFQALGFLVEHAQDCATATRCQKRQAFDLVLLDQQLPDGLGIELLPTLLKQEPELQVIMMTGAHDLELAIQAIRSGAIDFVHKPIKVNQLEHRVMQANRTLHLSREVTALRPQKPAEDLNSLIGRSDAMLEVSKAIALAARSDAPVLITGESGTGKEVVSRLIHDYSERPGPFVAVNCAAIVETLLESELFGHEKGAFTGAVSRRVGRFELARQGSLLLDEIGEMAPGLQAKLLRVLQEGTFERVGGTQQLKSSARIIAATNRDLAAEVDDGTFRQDLFYRLNVLTIHIPALRERPEDIPLLVGGLLERIGLALHKPGLSVDAGGLDCLCGYGWPGNVRELENVLTQAVLRTNGRILNADLLSLPEAKCSEPPTAHDDEVTQSLAQVEAAHLRRVLKHTGGHKTRSCEVLGISRPALDRKIKKYGIDISNFMDES